MVFSLNFEISKIASLLRAFYRGKSLDKGKRRRNKNRRFFFYWLCSKYPDFEIGLKKA